MPQTIKFAMRPIFLMWFLVLFNAFSGYSQEYEYVGNKKKKLDYIPRYPMELGFHIGTSIFLGDLGGTETIGRSFITDSDAPSIRPSIGFFWRYNMGGNFSFRLEMTYLMLAGDDKLAGNGNFSATKFSNQDGWFRYYRNLHFQSHCFEMTNSVEITPYNFKIQKTKTHGKSKHHIIAPYGVLGVGFLVFGPQANYNNEWVDLAPLSTEGQGLVEGKNKYSLTQFIIPMGFGLRWEYDHSYIFSFEVNHRLTFTDYLDDVSTDYVNPSVFENNFDPSKAALAAALARRSQEQDPHNIYGYITAPGQQRGDPKDNDSYYSFTFRIAFYLKRSRPYALVKDY